MVELGLELLDLRVCLRARLVLALLAKLRAIWSSWQTLRRRLRGEQVLARALAAPALLGTQPAVLVVMGVALALLGAFPARDQAGLELVVLDPRVGIRLAGDDARGRDAGVGAVEAEAQAALEVADLVLGERCVGADRAVRGASAALVDAPSEHGRVDDERPRMSLEDGFNAHIRAGSSTALAPSRAGIYTARRPATGGATRACRLDVGGSAWRGRRLNFSPSGVFVRRSGSRRTPPTAD